MGDNGLKHTQNVHESHLLLFIIYYKFYLQVIVRKSW